MYITDKARSARSQSRPVGVGRVLYRPGLTDNGEIALMPSRRRAATLREQAQLLRSLADGFDIPTIRDQLLDLAARCDALAKSIEEDNPPTAEKT
jgi:hypothetical protein